MWKVLRVGILAGLAAAGLAWYFQGDTGPRVEMAGYFKSDRRDRVVAWRAERPLTEGEARAVFDRVSVTPGTVTRSVIYTGADAVAPQDALTFAKSLRDALIVTANPPFDQWDWIMHVNPAGETSISAN